METLGWVITGLVAAGFIAYVAFIVYAVTTPYSEEEVQKTPRERVREGIRKGRF